MLLLERVAWAGPTKEKSYVFMLTFSVGPRATSRRKTHDSKAGDPPGLLASLKLNLNFAHRKKHTQ